MLTTASRIGSWTRTVLLALFVVMFAAVPIVDAAACGSEFGPPHAAAADVGNAVDGIDAGDRSDTGGDIAPDHGLCGHGHCHHHAGNTNSASIDTLQFETLSHGLAGDDARNFHIPDGLMRPPKA